MIKMSRKELNKKIVQAQIRAVKATLSVIALYSLGFAGIVYMFIK